MIVVLWKLSVFVGRFKYLNLKYFKCYFVSRTHKLTNLSPEEWNFQDFGDCCGL